MKSKLKVATALLAISSSLVSCSSTDDIMNSDRDDDSRVAYHEDFAQYYDIDGGKGLELYAWKVEEEWFSGLMTGTNRLKGVDEIEALQENPCPLNIMKDILMSYPTDVHYYCYLAIVSTPPLECELLHSDECKEKYPEDYEYLATYFGIYH